MKSVFERTSVLIRISIKNTLYYENGALNVKQYKPTTLCRCNFRAKRRHLPILYNWVIIFGKISHSKKYFSANTSKYCCTATAIFSVKSHSMTSLLWVVLCMCEFVSTG
jgi:hypothetical protein